MLCPASISLRSEICLFRILDLAGSSRRLPLVPLTRSTPKSEGASIGCRTKAKALKDPSSSLQYLCLACPSPSPFVPYISPKGLSLLAAKLGKDIPPPQLPQPRRLLAVNQLSFRS